MRAGQTHPAYPEFDGGAGLVNQGLWVSKIYLAGPMQGYPERNYPLFMKVAAEIRGLGYEVFNPAEFPDEADGTFDLRKTFAAYSKFICEEADALVLLPSWSYSSGATTEQGLAKNCGLLILEYFPEGDGS